MPYCDVTAKIHGDAAKHFRLNFSDADRAVPDNRVSNCSTACRSASTLSSLYSGKYSMRVSSITELAFSMTSVS